MQEEKPTDKTLFIINPISGGRRRKPVQLIKRIKFIYRQLGHDFEIKIWREKDQIHEIMEYAKSGIFTKVIAAGGDGTVLAVGSELIGTDIALGIIPRGSGNGYASHLGYKKKLDWVINQNVNSRIVRVDTGLIDGKKFLNCAGIGIQGHVAQEFSKSKIRGLASYIAIGTRLFFSYEPRDYTLTIDDDPPIDLEGVLALEIMNGREWGRGAKVAPFSSITDGIMSVVFIKKIHAGQIPKLFPLVFRGRIHRHPHVTTYEGKKFRIQRKDSGLGQLDGDAMTFSNDISAEVIPRSLNVMVPAETDFFL